MEVAQHIPPTVRRCAATGGAAYAIHRGTKEGSTVNRDTRHGVGSQRMKTNLSSIILTHTISTVEASSPKSWQTQRQSTLSPTWDLSPDGPMALENILSSLKRPHRRLALCAPTDADVLPSSKFSVSISKDRLKSGEFSVLTTFLSGLLGFRRGCWCGVAEEVCSTTSVLVLES